MRHRVGCATCVQCVQWRRSPVLTDSRHLNDLELLRLMGSSSWFLALGSPLASGSSPSAVGLHVEGGLCLRLKLEVLCRVAAGRWALTHHCSRANFGAWWLSRPELLGSWGFQKKGEGVGALQNHTNPPPSANPPRAPPLPMTPTCRRAPS